MQVKLNGKWGIRSVTNEEILPAIYDNIESVEDNFLIKINDKNGVINSAGEVVTPIIYDETEVTYNTILVRKGDKWGALDRSGCEVILAEVFDKIDDMALAPCLEVTLAGKKGIISINGSIIVFPDCEDVWSVDFYNTFGVKNEGKWQIVDRKNRPKNSQFYDDIRGMYESGMIAVLKDYKWRFLNANGQEASSLYVDEYLWQYPYLIIRINDKWGALNLQMEEILKVEYDNIEIEKIGLREQKTDGGTGVVDKVGNVIIPPVYDYVDSFVCKYADKILGKKEGEKDDVYIPTQYIEVCKNKKHGVSDILGNEVIPVIYDLITIFQYGDDDPIPVCLDDKWGFVDKENQVIIPFFYDDAEYFDEHTAIVSIDGKTGLIDKTGQIIFPLKYEWIIRLNDILRVWQDGKMFELATDDTGKIVEYYDNATFFNTIYFPANPDGYSNNLRDMTKKTKHHFTYDLLTEIRDGRFDKQDDFLTFLPNVRYILHSNEAYGRFASFMSSLRIEAKSLQEPSNAIRKVYLDFRNGTPQQWKLIDPDEYLSALKNNQSLTTDKVSQWVAMAKENIQLFAANSYLTSGPCLDPRITDSEGQNTLYLLWYYLTGDEIIPYQAMNRISKEELSARERYFNRTYWNPFVSYMGTRFGDGGPAYETDSTLYPLFDLVAEFEKYQMDADKNLVTLTRLINIVHGRGTISYLFVENGNKKLIKI